MDARRACSMVMWVVATCAAAAAAVMCLIALSGPSSESFAHSIAAARGKLRAPALGIHHSRSSAVDVSHTDVCPDFPLLHSTCSVTFHFIDFGCKDVREEVVRRTQGKDGWVDPRSALATYALLNSSNGETLITRRNGEHLRLEDRVRFAYTDKGSEGCEVRACSTTDAYIKLDLFSTNYCNMHNLICGEAEGCDVCRHSFAPAKETFHNCGFHDKNYCLSPTPPPGTMTISKQV